MSTKIYLRANNGNWVCAENGGGREVVANRPSPHQWETFQIINASDSAKAPNYGQSIYLKACNGQYVCAEGGGGREVVANRPSPHQWETFVLTLPPGLSATVAIVPGKSTPVAFRAWNGQFVCAESGGGREVVANRGAVGPWETFSLEVAGIGDTFVPVFPIKASKDGDVQNGSNGNHMHTDISIDKAGLLSGTTHTWTDNTWQGMHAVSNVALLDDGNNLIWHSEDCICGVAGKIDPTGPHNRYCQFSTNIPFNILNNIRRVAIIHRAEPHSLFLDWLDQNWPKVIATAVTVIVIIASS